MQWRFLVWLFFIGNVISGRAQQPAYPKGYFRNPMGIPMELSANFGELRPNHWHMGLDIRTGGKENLPVYAAAGGYIAHVGIRPQSFGRFIIINHPNGLSTLYAHLNDFYPELESYVTEQQYKKESWAVELDFKAGEFDVTKGQFIAYSGNTGGSQGPHLHFEILDTKTTKRLNPSLFDFPLVDRVAPTLLRLAMYDRSRSVYEQTPRFYPLKYTDSGYIIPKMPVIVTGLNRISFALQMHDKSSTGGSPNGVFSASLYIDSVLQSRFVLDSIDYEETDYLNAQIDYKYDYKGGAYLQHLSRMPGDNGVAYIRTASDGVLTLTDTLPHQVYAEVKDAYGNTAYLNFWIQHDDSLSADEAERLTVAKMIPNRVNEINKPDFDMYLPSGCLFDTVPAYYYRDNAAAYNSVSARHQVNDPSYPVHNDLTVRIKPDKSIPADWKNKLVIVKSGKGNVVRKAEWKDDWLVARFGDFGSFQAFADITPPSINEPGGTRSKNDDTLNMSAMTRILFTPADNFGLKRFRVELDSQWIRFTNDKSRNWIYRFDERCSYGIHHLRAIAEDLAGNTTVKEWWFRRNPYTPPPPKKKVVKKTSEKKKKEEDKKKKSTTKKPSVKKKKK
ncbi:MAG: M23 family metallopeptidase [Bacteroidetes bacterium]|nr:M23 family metallopeptidase [Bacteroidota bacterium]